MEEYLVCILSVEARVEARDEDDGGIVGHIGAQGMVVVHDPVAVDEVHALSVETPEAAQRPLELHDAAVPPRLHHHDLPLKCRHPHGQRPLVVSLRNHLLGKLIINGAASVVEVPGCPEALGSFGGYSHAVAPASHIN